jgi:hypothetical protein
LNISAAGRTILSIGFAMIYANILSDTSFLYSQYICSGHACVKSLYVLNLFHAYAAKFGYSFLSLQSISHVIARPATHILVLLGNNAHIPFAENDFPETRRVPTLSASFVSIL